MPRSLAHSQGPLRNFADVRIVDEQDLQIPYVLEPRTGPPDGGGAVSRGRPRECREFARPRRESPVRSTRSRCRTRTCRSRSLIARDVRADLPAVDRARRPAAGRSPSSERLVRVVRAGRRGSTPNPRTPAPPLEIPFPRSRGRELLLIVEEGDNQPLPITRCPAAAAWLAAAVLPAGGAVAARLRPRRPRRAALRRGDAGAVGDEAAPPGRSAAAPEAVASTPTALVSPRVFWIGLSLAVVVLLGAHRPAAFAGWAAIFATCSMTRSRLPLQILPICASV